MAWPSASGNRWAAAVLAAAALLAVSPATALEEALRIDLPRLGADDRVDLTAERLDWERRTGRAEATGDVRLRSRGMTLTADTIRYDPGIGRAHAEGRVAIDYGHRRLLADHLHLSLDDDWARAEKARLDVVDPRTRRLRLRLEADSLVRESERRFVADRLRYTPCACPDDAPATWSLTAWRAVIVPGEGAWLVAPVLRVREVPVLTLPAFYLPLGDRRTGLLAPRFGYSGRNGWRVALPYYVTLGRSADLTLTAGWHGGVDTWTPPDETAAPARPGVRGFDQSLEVRWAPARRTRGTLLVSHLYDVHTDRLDEDAPARGSRGTLRAAHTSRFDGGRFGAPGHGLHLNANLLSDAALLGDLRPTLEQAQVGYLRSGARAHATPTEIVSVEAAGRWTQDVRTRLLGPAAERRVRPLFGEEAPETAQLLPHVFAGTGHVPAFGRLFARSDLHVLSWRRPFGEETRPPGILHVRGGADLSHGFFVGDGLAGRLSAGVWADAWRAEAPDRLAGIEPTPDADLVPGATALRAYPRFDARLHTGLERRYDGGITHRIRPGLRWRFIPRIFGDDAGLSLDAFDFAVPAAGLHQVAAAVDTSVWAGGRQIVEADLAQGVDLQAGRLADLELTASLTPIAYRHRLDGVVAWDPSERRIAWATAQGRLVGAAGAGLQVRWSFVQPEGGARLLSGLDEIFSAGALPPPPLLDARGGPAEIHEVHFGISAPRIRGFSLRYNVRAELSDHPRTRLPQHAVTARYVSPCRCWSGAVTSIWPPGAAIPELVIQLELAGLGSVATQRGGF